MLLTTLSLFHVAAALLCRDQQNTIFDRDDDPGRHAAASLRSRAARHRRSSPPWTSSQRIVGTEALTFTQWCICVGIALSIVVVEELIKLVIRRRSPVPRPTLDVPTPAAVPPSKKKERWSRPSDLRASLAVAALRSQADHDRAVRAADVPVDNEEQMMTTFTVWKFDDPDGAAHAASLLKSAEDDGLVKVVDHAVMTWPVGARQAGDPPLARRPEARRRPGVPCGASSTGALFAVPVVGGVVGVALGALAKSTEGTGITKDDLARIRTEIVEGTSALFLVTDEGDLDRLGERFRGVDHDADQHQPHRGRARDAPGDLRRGLTRSAYLRTQVAARPTAGPTPGRSRRCRVER